MSVLDRLVGGLIVSCQARQGHPLRSAEIIARLAQCAVLGGAVGVRVNSPEDVRAVRAAVGDLPIVALHKVRAADRDLITPRFELAEGLAEAGADVIAFEATARIDGDPARLIARIHDELRLPVMADVATAAEGFAAWDAGADLVSSTLSGYTSDSPQREEPDLDLVAALAAYGARTVAEGRLITPDHVRSAFAAGACAVVVGTAVTDPAAIARRLAMVSPAFSRDTR
ncbi:putative N-acetylmannosamine-6-phosphate 2-epimerase [Hamadaea sp. NPDC050747]|uniref:N-acetylmannosamine-6-phosphate 2-epimerase n=1 Tax=Hamadaea sp. NPDC050747 TaxID=3155789 RepID=UPI0033C68F79